MDAVEDIAFLSGSEQRVALLRLLVDEESLTRQELREECDATNVTLSRNLEKLVAKGWVEERNRSYELSISGSEIIEEYLDLLGTVERVNKLDAFLQLAPKTAFDLDLGALSDVAVTVGEKHCPLAPIDEYVDLLADAREARILLQPVGLAALATGGDAIFENDPRLDVVVQRDIVRSQEPGGERFSVLEALLDHDDCSVRISDGDIPLCLVVTGRLLQLGAQDEHNHPRAIVQTESAQAREWARAKFADFWQRAEPMTRATLQ